METSQITLAIMLLYSFLFGIAVGVFYDANRVVRVLFGVRYTKKAYERLYGLRLPISKRRVNIGKSNGFLQSLVINLGDFACVLAAAVGVLLINYGYNSGRFRFFTLAATALGFVIYRLSAGRLVIFLAEPLAFLCKYLLLAICDILGFPLMKILAILSKFVKKFFSLFIFTLANKIKKLYNIREEVFVSEDAQKSEENADANSRWRYKKGGGKNGKE